MPSRPSAGPRFGDPEPDSRKRSSEERIRMVWGGASGTCDRETHGDFATALEGLVDGPAPVLQAEPGARHDPRPLLPGALSR